MQGALTAADVKEKLGAEVFIKGLDGEDFDKIPDDTMEDDGVLAMLQERYEEMPVENQLKVIEKVCMKICKSGIWFINRSNCLILSWIVKRLNNQVS